MSDRLEDIISGGETEYVEFKASISSGLTKELAAFANAGGGVVYVGVADDGAITGTPITNATISQVLDLARNCDPPISVEIRRVGKRVLAIHVPKSADRPHQCRDGFYVRVGATSQKLRRDELLSFLSTEGFSGFDRAINSRFDYPADFSDKRFLEFRRLLATEHPAEPLVLLRNLGAVLTQPAGGDNFTNAAVLCFAEDPQAFFPESYISCVRYRGIDRGNVVDRHDYKGSLIEQMEAAFSFVEQRQQVAYVLDSQMRRSEVYEYPLAAVREVLVNAVMHRDYLYHGSHIYLSLYADRLEVENPGGLARGIRIDELGKVSVRRNPLIAELLHRTGYVEAIGSGFARICAALSRNQNGPPKIESTNFFRITLFAAAFASSRLDLSVRQNRILVLLNEKGRITKRDCAEYLLCSEDTALRELRGLVKLELIERQGRGKGTVYVAKPAGSIMPP